MKKKVMLLVLVGILSTTVSYAQKVTQSANGAIIDASAIPHTTVKKARSTDATNASVGSNTAANIGSKVSNEKVYVKFEVYKSNNTTSIMWLNMVNQCKNSTVDGGGWRMPTYRELQLMWVLKPELEKIEGFVSFYNSSYWSATEYLDKSYVVNFTNGQAVYGDRYAHYKTRCIRDL